MLGKVRAKFFVASVNHMATPGSAPAATITLTPVFGGYGDGKDNESWSKYTPSGKLEMNVTNPAAIEFFTPGNAYYVDFTEANPAPIKEDDE